MTNALNSNAVMECAPPAGRGFSPLDEELGLLRGSLTPSLVEDLALLGSWLPFGPAAKNVGHFRRIEVSEATARRVTEQSGQAYVELQTEEAELLEAAMRAAPAGPELQQLSVDGAMVPLLGGEWAEVKTLAIGIIDEADRKGEARTRDLSYFSRMTDHLRFAQLAMVETHRRSTERAGTVCAVVDGAEWPQKFIDLHRPDAVRILDWCHGAEHLAQAGQAAFGAGTAALSEWLGTELHQLKHGEPELTLRGLRGLCRKLDRDGAGGDDGLKTVKGSLRYLEKRRGQIRYAEFRAQGYPIGSGAVESANKLVVEARLKGAGMHWAREHVNPMVVLGTAVCSGRWEEVWPQISRRLREKVGAGRQTKPSSKERPAEKEASGAKTRPEVRRPEVPTTVPPLRSPTPSHRPPAPNHPWRRMTIGRKPLPPKPT